ncbi:hypothetical protein D3C81_2085540 [compost metagenome]
MGQVEFSHDPAGDVGISRTTGMHAIDAEVAPGLEPFPLWGSKIQLTIQITIVNKLAGVRPDTHRII